LSRYFGLRGSGFRVSGFRVSGFRVSGFRVWGFGGGRGSSPRETCFFFFFFTVVTGPRRSWSLKLRDTRVHEPQTRARLGTTAHFCKVVVLKLRARVTCMRSLRPWGSHEMMAMARAASCTAVALSGARILCAVLEHRLFDSHNRTGYVIRPPYCYTYVMRPPYYVIRPPYCYTGRVVRNRCALGRPHTLPSVGTQVTGLPRA